MRAGTRRTRVPGSGLQWHCWGPAAPPPAGAGEVTAHLPGDNREGAGAGHGSPSLCSARGGDGGRLVCREPLGLVPATDCMSLGCWFAPPTAQDLHCPGLPALLGWPCYDATKACPWLGACVRVLQRSTTNRRYTHAHTHMHARTHICKDREKSVLVQQLASLRSAGQDGRLETQGKVGAVFLSPKAACR